MSLLIVVRVVRTKFDIYIVITIDYL